MSMALDYTYQYPFPSSLEAKRGQGPALALATCNFDHSSPHFFDGRVRQPRVMGDMLVTLSDVVRTHFFKPVPTLLDPVLTSNEELLRLEGFSGCCGVYARVDLPAEAFDGSCHGRGTTNVDFNTPMRNALTRLRDNEEVSFAIGKEEVVLSKGEQQTVEKKVKLPVRWVKGFSEVQSYQPQLQLRMEISAGEALRFVRSLPKVAKPKMPSYALSVGKSIRLSQRPQRGAVQFSGTHRVKAIEPLLPRAKTLRVWADENQGTSAWEVCFELGSFFLLISPEVYRGFSGEGQLLANLASPPPDSTIAQVRAQLAWQSHIRSDDLAHRLQLPESAIQSSLAVLGSRGLAGFDATRNCYYHRELPFDLEKIEELQPRLRSARSLLAKATIKAVESSDQSVVFEVPGTDTIHRVSLSPEQDACTCPWYSKHQGKRGPCKHVLAARIVQDEESA